MKRQVIAIIVSGMASVATAQGTAPASAPARMPDWSAPPASAIQRPPAVRMPQVQPPAPIVSQPEPVAVTASPPTAAAGAASPAARPAPAALGEPVAAPSSPDALARLPDDAAIALGDGSVRVTAAELRKLVPVAEKQVAAISGRPPELAGLSPRSLGAAAGAGTATRSFGKGGYKPPVTGTVAPIRCDQQLALGGQAYISTVNGVARGAVLSPGPGRIEIVGCGFGSQGSRTGVYLVSPRHGFSQKLDTPEWRDQRIGAYWGAPVSGFGDLDDLAVLVELEDGRRLEQRGHAFRAEREIRVLSDLHRGLLVSAGTRPMPEWLPGDGKATSAVVNTQYRPSAQFCAAEQVRADRFRAGAVALPAGWSLHDVLVHNLTDQHVADVGESFVAQPEVYGPALHVTLGYDARNQNAFDARWEGSDVVITPQWHSLYIKKFLWMGGYSLCSSRYSITVLAAGPRGTWS